METEKLNRLRRNVENLTKTAEILASDADDFPAIYQNTQRLKACIRMMEIALGQVTMTAKKQY